jgi:hypothetical protein
MTKIRHTISDHNPFFTVTDQIHLYRHIGWYSKHKELQYRTAIYMFKTKKLPVIKSIMALPKYHLGAPKMRM